MFAISCSVDQKSFFSRGTIYDITTNHKNRSFVSEALWHFRVFFLSKHPCTKIVQANPTLRWWRKQTCLIFATGGSTQMWICNPPFELARAIVAGWMHFRTSPKNIGFLFKPFELLSVRLVFVWYFKTDLQYFNQAKQTHFKCSEITKLFERCLWRHNLQTKTATRRITRSNKFFYKNPCTTLEANTTLIIASCHTWIWLSSCT